VVVLGRRWSYDDVCLENMLRMSELAMNSSLRTSYNGFSCFARRGRGVLETTFPTSVLDEVSSVGFAEGVGSMTERSFLTTSSSAADSAGCSCLSLSPGMRMLGTKEESAENIILTRK
jgi:hypothetical protein